MIKSKDEIEDKLEFFSRRLRKISNQVEQKELPEENIPKGHRMAGSKAKAVALYKMSLERCDDAVEDFLTAVKWYQDSITEYRERRDSPSDNFEGETTLLNYLYCAILSGNEGFQKEAAEIALDTESEHYSRFSTEHRYHFMNALASMMLDNGDQQIHLDKLDDALAEPPADHQRFFGALHTTLSGIVSDDSAQFQEGAEQFLDWHDDNVDFENKTSAEDLVCKQIAALWVLARRNGMDVTVDSPYLPDCLEELVELQS
jgi:hypothetical protein